MRSFAILLFAFLSFSLTSALSKNDDKTEFDVILKKVNPTDSEEFTRVQYKELLKYMVLGIHDHEGIFGYNWYNPQTNRTKT